MALDGPATAVSGPLGEVPGGIDPGLGNRVMRNGGDVRGFATESSAQPGLIRATLLVAAALLPPLGCTRMPDEAADSRPAPLHAPSLAEAVAAARAGDVITVPAGTYPGGIVLPPGVILRGAGIDKTVLDARASDDGLTVAGGRGAEVSDLTVRGAKRTGLLVREAEAVTLRRVRATGGREGIRLASAVRATIENAISDGNRDGIVLDGGRDNAVVNCTVAENAGDALSVIGGERLIAFNNALAHCGAGVAIAAPCAGLKLDDNLYDVPLVGRTAARSLGQWQARSGQDAHSVQLPLRFRDAKGGDFRPAGTLAWALDRATTTDWGTAELEHVKAPERDLDGAPRSGRPDVGAYELALSPARSPDGRITIRNDAGRKSAGLFAPEGREVVRLFQELPLPAGVHPFWFPARDSQGRPPAAGTYELKTVEGQLTWEYAGAIGGDRQVAPPNRGAAGAPLAAVFDGQGRLIVGEAAGGGATVLRGHDAASGRWLWSVGGNAAARGLALGKTDDAVRVLLTTGAGGAVLRIDPKSGKAARHDGEALGIDLDGKLRPDGLAALAARLYLVDRASATVREAAEERKEDAPAFSRRLSIAEPLDLAGDPEGGLLWVLSGKKIVALDAEGKLVAETEPVAEPAALAARGRRLAVASRKTGKVHRFDARDPKNVKPEGTVGRGDGPSGPIVPDRFGFQARGDRPGAGSRVRLALGPGGELAVIEGPRVGVFGADGRRLWSSFGLPGRALVPSFAEPGRWFDDEGRVSIRLDERAGSAGWAPEAFWDLPAQGEFLGQFSGGGRSFGVLILRDAGLSGGALLVLRYEGDAARPVLLLARDRKSGKLFERRDSNGNGRLDRLDATTTPADALPEGLTRAKHVDLFPRGGTLLTLAGDLLALNVEPGTLAALWPRAGEDGAGVPVYRPGQVRRFPRPETEGGGRAPWRLSGAALTADGGLVGLLRAGPVVAFDAEGNVRWSGDPAGRGQALRGLGAVGPLVVVGAADTGEFVVFTPDGLPLGSFGPAPVPGALELDLDGPHAIQAVRDGDGRSLVLVADPGRGVHHLWRLKGEATLHRSAAPVTLSAAAAAALR